jgi:hypothetical protein
MADDEWLIMIKRISTTIPIDEFNFECFCKNRSGQRRVMNGATIICHYCGMEQVFIQKEGYYEDIVRIKKNKLF